MLVGSNSRKCISLLLLAFLGGCAASKRGILIMAHGGDPEWNRDVEAVVEPLRAKYPTEIAFGMAQSSSIQQAVDRLEKQGVRDIAVVRMFVSGDSFVPATEYILGLRDTPPADPLASRGSECPAATAHLAASDGHAPGGTNHAGDHPAQHEQGAVADHHGGHHMEPPAPIRSKSRFALSHEGVGDSPLVDEILLDRVKALSSEPARESVLIVAHGPADDAENERWLANMNRRVQQLGELGAFRQIHCETLREDWPERRQAAEQRIRDFVGKAGQDANRCIVIPFRVSGFGPYKEVLAGLDYTADERGFCPHPNMTEWIEQAAETCWP